MNTSRALSVLLVTALAAPGCATVFKGKSTGVTVEGAAQVTVDGRTADGPTIALSNKHSHTIHYRTATGEEGSCVASSHVSAGWVVLDVLAGGIGWIIDLATGNWRSLDASDCALTTRSASR